MAENVLWIVVMAAGTGAIVWGAELFAEHLAEASSRLGISAFALALLLAGAEPEELATVATASARGVDGVAFGDVIGANAAIVTVALAAGVFVATMPFGTRIRRYGTGGLVAAACAGVIVWDGTVSRPEGAVLVAGYVAFVAIIWIIERQPPALGETGELDELRSGPSRIGRDLLLVLLGLAALTGGSIVLVEGVRRLSGLESTQTRLGLIVVGFATAFELVVLAWSASRRGITDAVVAGVIGSYAYNLTMSLGAGALIAPISIADAGSIQIPFVAMSALMALVLVFSMRNQSLDKRHGPWLLLGYGLFVATALFA
jgi:cation:H+ antiporter